MRLLALSVLLIFSVSVSSQQFSKIDSTIQSLIDGNKIPGGVAMVWQDGRIVHQKAYGWKNPDHSEVMTMDAMFRIAGLGITTEAGSKVTGATSGSFFWGGAFNTSYLVDRQKRVITLFMFQRAPFDLPGKLSMLERYAFQTLNQ